MPDKNVHQEMIDRGWDQMARLLDKEMPVRDRRRGAFWWLSGIAAFVLVAAVTVIVYSNRVSPDSDPIEQSPSEKAIAEAQNTISTTPQQVPVPAENAAEGSHVTRSLDEPAEQVNNGISQLSSAPVVQKHSAVTGKKTVAPPTPEATQRTEKFIPAASVEVTTQDSELAGLKEQHEIVSRMSSDAPEEPVTFSIDESPEPPSVDVSSEILQERISVSVGAMKSGIISAFATPLRLETIIPKSVQSRKPVELQALAAVHLNKEGSPFYGIEAGGVLVLRADRRLRIRTGLSYGFYNVDGIGLFAFANNRQADAAELGPGTSGPLYDPVAVVTGTLEFEAANQLTEKFHYLHVPLLVEFRVTPRWSVAAGARTSLLLGAPARYRLSDEQFAANYQANAPTSRSFLYDYDLLRKIDIAPEFMISWKAGSRLWLDAGYIHGIVPYINQSGIPGRGDYHRMIQVGARYSIL